MAIEKKCEYCGATFTPGKHSHRQRFCSRECQLKGCQRRRRKLRGKTEPFVPVKKICPYCGKEFLAQHPQKKYCSPHCAYEHDLAEAREKHRAALKPKICPQCGKEFTPRNQVQKYCCARCCYNFNRKKNLPPKELEPRQCAHCGKEFKPNHGKQIFCSKECRYQNSLKKAKIYRAKRADKRGTQKFSEHAFSRSEAEMAAVNWGEEIKVPHNHWKPFRTPKDAWRNKKLPARRVEIKIPAAVAENRAPTIEELLDWIFGGD